MDDASSEEEDRLNKMPHHYHLCGADDEGWRRRVRDLASWTKPGEISWGPSTVVVYGRKVCTPRHRSGIVYWDFGRLVEAFGPADYITMASSYHTFIVDQVPVLTLAQKNEARRFITFLDAPYEARCKLVVRADRGPDDLFFPENRRASWMGARGQTTQRTRRRWRRCTKTRRRSFAPTCPTTTPVRRRQEAGLTRNLTWASSSKSTLATRGLLRQKTSASPSSGPRRGSGSCAARGGMPGRETGGSRCRLRRGTGRAGWRRCPRRRRQRRRAAGHDRARAWGPASRWPRWPGCRGGWWSV